MYKEHSQEFFLNLRVTQILIGLTIWFSQSEVVLMSKSRIIRPNTETMKCWWALVIFVVLWNITSINIYFYLNITQTHVEVVWFD